MNNNFKILIHSICIILLLTISSLINTSNSVNNIKLYNTDVVSEVLTVNNVRAPSAYDIINTLSYNMYDGRRVGTAGNKKAGEYISQIFGDLQLESLFGYRYYDEYRQRVIAGSGNKGYGYIIVPSYTSEKVRNIIGVIKGRESENAVVLSAHFDSIGYKNGKMVKGSLDNASGVAAIIRAACYLQEENGCNKDIIIACFNGEESGLDGSSHFVSRIKNNYSNIYNINVDCVCGKDSGLISLYNNSKISNELTREMKNSFKKHNIKYSDTPNKKGTSDHKSFEENGYPNIYLGQDNVSNIIHTYKDTPENIDCDDIENLAKCISDFIIESDNLIF